MILDATSYMYISNHSISLYLLDNNTTQTRIVAYGDKLLIF